MKNLILSGGIYHPFAETSQYLSQRLQALGLDSVVTGVADGLALLAREQFDLLTVNALAFSMVQAHKYAPLRDEFAFEPGEADRAAILSHMDRGGGLLGLHTAAICFDTWPQWGEILGAQWVWGQSHHPAPNHITVKGPDTSFTIWDELYCDLRICNHARVLAVAGSPDVSAQQPVLTVKDRSVYLALGHDMNALRNEGYAHLLESAVHLALEAQPGGRIAAD